MMALPNFHNSNSKATVAKRTETATVNTSFPTIPAAVVAHNDDSDDSYIEIPSPPTPPFGSTLLNADVDVDTTPFDKNEYYDVNNKHYYYQNDDDQQYQQQQQQRRSSFCHRRSTLPPTFHRRSTIRDSVDLSYSIEEFVRTLNNNNK